MLSSELKAETKANEAAEINMDDLILEIIEEKKKQRNIFEL